MKGKAPRENKKKKKKMKKETSRLTTPINIILALRNVLPIHDPPHPRLLTHIPKALAQDDDLVPRDLVLLDRLANDLLAHTVAVHIRGIPSVEAAVVSGFKQREGLFFVDDPGLPLGGPEAHGAEDWVGDAQAAGPEAVVGCFGGGDGAQDGVLLGGAIGGGHFVGWNVGEGLDF